MTLKYYIKQECVNAIENLYHISSFLPEIQVTKPEFNADYTLVLFPLVKQLKKKPEEIGEEIGNYLAKYNKINSFNIVKGFLNLSLENKFFTENLSKIYSNPYGFNREENEEYKDYKSQKIMVEYSSPNTNKPIHLGHLRNDLLGYSISNILKASGNTVIMAQIINDRGIHICKSMLAWKKFSNGETPQSSGIKGDHLVGKYYVLFDKEYQKEINVLCEEGMSREEAKKKAPILLEAQEMLQKWEENDPEVRKLWEQMNHWVYEGFEKTYQRLGVSFDVNQYESNTYLLGKNIVEKGLKDGILYKKEDGSVWIDLSEEGLDQKLLLRSDGTSVYMTQDLGTAVERFQDYNLDQLIYTVGNEQDYHFQVLFLTLKKLGYSWADKLFHLSYGMVNLPEGKMKSREGTVVDADDIIEQMFESAKEKSSELGKLQNLTESEKSDNYEKIGLAALKYYILKVEPKKTILFDPKESIELNGNTGPFIQYTYARICSLMRNAKENDESGNLSIEISNIPWNETEKSLIKNLESFEEVIHKSANELNPSLIANYAYEISREFNYFYQHYKILTAETRQIKNNRLALSLWTAHVIKKSLTLLGIDTIERM